MSGIMAEAVRFLPFGGAALAACSGALLWRGWRKSQRLQQMRRDALVSGGDPSSARHGKHDALIAAMKRLAVQQRTGQARILCPPVLMRTSGLHERLAVAGLANEVSAQAFFEMRVRLAAILGLAGMAIGCIFSGELAFLLAVVGIAVGFRMPAASLKRRAEERTSGMEAHLPEMMDVMALGMRSGLSFDAALRLYESHFSTELAADLKQAQRSWEAGLESRAEALRQLAATYDSPLLARVVEQWIRSLRFGTSMVEGLEAEGAQARAACKAKREERIAKAPVKMMIPTGALILPAMLILVLGPVLLELMNGGM